MITKHNNTQPSSEAPRHRGRPKGAKNKKTLKQEELKLKPVVEVKSEPVEEVIVPIVETIEPVITKDISEDVEEQLSETDSEETETTISDLDVEVDSVDKPMFFDPQVTRITVPAKQIKINKKYKTKKRYIVSTIYNSKHYICKKCIYKIDENWYMVEFPIVITSNAKKLGSPVLFLGQKYTISAISEDYEYLVFVLQPYVGA